jgi:hypothetical protein
MQKYKVKTPHFVYALNVLEKKTPFHTIDFSVGKEPNVCLTASIFLPDIDKSLMDMVDTCTLHTIDALEECAMKWDEKESFGTELLYSFISILSANFPHITKIKLQDASYIPCKPHKKDTLDLITYSIALYGKTWYEQKAAAHLSLKKHQDQYEKEIENYIKPSAKVKIPFLDIYKQMITNTYARDLIGSDIKKYEEFYNTSDTLPIFFKKLSKQIPQENKCKFFKDWLESFIATYVHIHREWIIPFKLNKTLETVLNVSSAKPMKAHSRTQKNIKKF